MRIAMLVAAMCGFLFVGCGVSAEEKADETAKERAVLAARRERRERMEAQAVYTACSSAFSGLQDTLGELDSRLSVGLNYERYGTAVADARVAYDQIDFDHLAIPHGGELNCLGPVGIPLERALNQYTAAYDTWNVCFEDIYCDADSIQSELQAHWAKATRAIAKSKSNLADMEPSPS